MEISKAYNGSDIVLTKLSKLDHGMYHHSLFPCLDKWGTKKANSTSKRAQIRCLLSLYLFILCAEVFSNLMT